MDSARIKELLRGECDYYPSEEILDIFLDSMTERRLRPKETLIAAGERNENIYLLTDGVVRSVLRDEYGEHTRAFATGGTLFLSYSSYCLNRPALVSIEACCDSSCLVCTKSDFDSLLADYPEFAFWQLRLAYFQLHFYEMGLSIIKGRAKERFLALARNRPIILEKVPLKVIASYLGITQVYLSRLRHELLR